MKSKKIRSLAASIAEIAAGSPSEKLTEESRYIILADLRMGDGGKKDELVRAKKALFAILGKWYLPRGYTLVLNGDIEDLRRFWLRDILAAWPEMYALFDAYNEKGRLRKIVGERDLALLRLRSYPYELSHGLRLDGDGHSLVVLHGHQASRPFVGRDYLSDYMVHWQGSAKRPKAEDGEPDMRERLKTEVRLYRAASRLGMATIQGHTRRPLFESLTNRDSIRSEPAVSPCLFSPGRVLGARAADSIALRMIELKDGTLSMVRWTTAKGKRRYLRSETRATSIQGLFERLEALGGT